MEFITLVLCVGVVAYKLALAWRLNVNWDEFYFLNHVYALTRNELTVLLQGAYTHAFTWLTRVPGTEVDQIVAGRLVMIPLLGITAWLVWKLARIWMQGIAALVPPFVFLTFMPVLEHGGSFRADSLLAPLSVVAVLLLLSPQRRSRSDWLAGAILGIAFAVTAKVVLFGPLVALVIACRRASKEAPHPRWSSAALSMARVGAAAGIVAIALLGLHALSVKADDVQSVANVASSSVDKTLVQTPWFPRADYLRRYIDWQPVPWILIAVGTAIALARRRFDVASMSLSLLPLAFYRNAFPYYFVVMLAPASVLAGWAFAELAAMTRRHASEWVASSLVAVLWLGSVFNGVRYFDRLNFDEQAQQREVLVGIHQIFPEPVAYIDRCGMVSSFTKANFFMSSWGFDAYSARGAPVMRSILAAQQPAFVLVNVPALSPTHSAQPALLPEDQEVLAKHYVSYWGPVRVAGADVALAGTSAQRVTVPFAAKYRVITAEPVMIDDRVRVDGDIIEVPERGVDMARTDETAGEPVQVRLVVATAQLPPAAEPIGFPLFKNL